MAFFNTEIQALQHWKKCLEHKAYYVEKQTSFGHIPWKYLGQSINFSAGPLLCSYMIAS